MYSVHLSAHLLLPAFHALGYILDGMSPDLFPFQCFIILGLLHPCNNRQYYFTYLLPFSISGADQRFRVIS